MTQITVALFLDYLRRSRLVEETRLDDLIVKMQAELGPEKSEQIEAITRWFISRKIVTEWQAKQLLRKRYKGFFLRQYKILSHLGAGGMSTVYLAEHSVMQRRVAIKVLPKKKLEKSVYLDRFIREAQTIASLDHPNIVRAYDIDQEDEVHYIVMEYFNGRNLQEVIAEDGVLSFEMAVDYVRQAALALEYAHQAGVVHRDVKPGNLLVNDQGLVKVLDLGLALLDEHNFDGQLTAIQEDKILGTADYLAPEQGIDSHTVDGRADIYGLGGVLYFCLTGHPPFPTGSIAQRLLAHQHEEPQSIFVDRPEAPDSLVHLCQKMMAKAKENRQQSALEVVADMQNWLINNGFADEADFPPLETLRATTQTMGAVPIPTQEQRLRDLDQEQWLASQQEEHLNLQDRQSNIGLAGGNADIVGYVDQRSMEGTADRFDFDLQQGSDGSTVSGMMRPVRKDPRSGSDASNNTRFGSASSTGSGNAVQKRGPKGGPSPSSGGAGSSVGSGDSASRIHLLTDGQSSTMMSNPNVRSQRQRGIIDDEDDAPLGTRPPAVTEENDPVLFALNEMGLTNPLSKPTQAAKTASAAATRATASQTQHPSQTTSPRVVADHRPSQTTSPARLVSQALAAESRGGESVAENDTAHHTSSHNRKRQPWHRHVPIWFWCLFGGFIISTIFLAGILVAIIFRM